MTNAALIDKLEARARGNPDAVPQAKALEDFREALGLTQLEFAGLLRLHPGHYLEIVKGESQLPIRAVRRAYALGISADSLLQTPKETNV